MKKIFFFIIFCFAFLYSDYTYYVSPGRQDVPCEKFFYFDLSVRVGENDGSFSGEWIYPDSGYLITKHYYWKSQGTEYSNGDFIPLVYDCVVNNYPLVVIDEAKAYRVTDINFCDPSKHKNESWSNSVNGWITSDDTVKCDINKYYDKNQSKCVPIPDCGTDKTGMIFDEDKGQCVCPDGTHFSNTQEKCMSDCPTQPAMEKMAIEKCGSLDFSKNISCNTDTGEVSIECMPCSEIMQSQYDLCSQNNMEVINGLSCSTNTDGSNVVNFDKIALSNCVMPDNNNTDPNSNDTDPNNDNTNPDNNNTNSDNNNTDLNSNDTNLDNNYSLQNIYNINKEIKQNLTNINDNSIKTNDKLDNISDTLKDSNDKLDNISNLLTDNNGTTKNGVIGALNDTKNYIKIEEKKYVADGNTSDEFPTIKVKIFDKDIVLLDDSYRDLIPFKLIKTILYVIAGVMAIIICIKTF
jgi:hypothetical protein